MSNSNISDKYGVVFVKFVESDTCTSTPSTPITQSDSCTCTCGKVKRVKKSKKSDIGGTSSNDKKQICFNCGTVGHIARNCPNRAFVHFSTPRREKESRGRSLTRNSSKSRLRDHDPKVHNDKKRADLKTNKHVLTKPTTGALLKSNAAEPISILSKGAFGSSTNPSQKFKRSKQKKNNSQSPVNISKPNY